MAYYQNRTPEDLMQDIIDINTEITRSIRFKTLTREYGIDAFRDIVRPINAYGVITTRTWTPGVFFPQCDGGNEASDAIHVFAINSRDSALTHLKWCILSQLYIKKIHDDQLVHYYDNGRRTDCIALGRRLDQIYAGLDTVAPFLRNWHRIAISARVVDDNLAHHIVEDEFLKFMTIAWPMMCYTMLVTILHYHHNPGRLRTAIAGVQDKINRVLCIMNHNYDIVARGYRNELEQLRSVQNIPLPLPADIAYERFTDYDEANCVGILN